MKNKQQIPVHDVGLLFEVIKKYPLSTVITHLNGSLEVSHLPVVAEMQPDGKVTIYGHLSTRNPQWHHLKKGASMMLIFNGPNTYINSSWYQVNDVSTWNYVTVRAEGLPVLKESYDSLLEILKATTDMTNTLYEDQWDFYIPDELQSEKSLTEAIGGFALESSNLSGKFKLSQSKSLDDQKRIIKELNLRSDENSRMIAKFMSDNLN